MIVKNISQIILNPAEQNDWQWVNVLQNLEHFRLKVLSTKVVVFETETDYYMSDADLKKWEQFDKVLEEMKAEQERDAEEEHRQFMDTIDRWKEQRKENI